jgi:hypothetical protein
MEQPDFVGLGRLVVIQDEGAKYASLIVHDKKFTPEDGCDYHVEIKKHVPQVISDVAHELRAQSGDHYKILHPDGEPLDPAAKTFVLRLDKEDDAHIAIRAYAEALRARGKLAEADALQMKYPLSGDAMNVQFVAGQRLLQLALGIIAGSVTIQKADTVQIADDISDLSPTELSEVTVATGRQQITLELTDVATRKAYVEAISAVRNPRPKIDG